MRTNVIVKLELDGLHNWPDAKKIFPEVAFLSDMHRHKWFITAKKRVTHDVRDVEFIMFKRDIEDYLRSKYYRKDYRSHFFGATSCEMLAKELKKQPNTQMSGNASAPMMNLGQLLEIIPAEQVEGYIGSLIRSKNESQKIQGLMLMREFQEVGKEIF